MSWSEIARADQIGEPLTGKELGFGSINDLDSALEFHGDSRRKEVFPAALFGCTCLFVRLFGWLFVWLFGWLVGCLVVCLFVRLFACVFVCLCV